VLVDAAGILLKPVFAQNIASLPRRQIGFAPLDRVLGFAQDRVNGLSRLLFLGPDGSFDFGPWLMRNPEVRQALSALKPTAWRLRGTRPAPLARRRRSDWRRPSARCSSRQSLFPLT
jgi:hypothetical protein